MLLIIKRFRSCCSCISQHHSKNLEGIQLLCINSCFIESLNAAFTVRQFCKPGLIEDIGGNATHFSGCGELAFSRFVWNHMTSRSLSVNKYLCSS